MQVRLARIIGGEQLVAEAAGGLAVGAHQHCETTLHLLEGPAVEPQKEQRSAIGLRSNWCSAEACSGRPRRVADPTERTELAERVEAESLAPGVGSCPVDC
jgi:hypothetical protein